MQRAVRRQEAAAAQVNLRRLLEYRQCAVQSFQQQRTVLDQQDGVTAATLFNKSQMFQKKNRWNVKVLPRRL